MGVRVDDFAAMVEVGLEGPGWTPTTEPSVEWPGRGVVRKSGAESTHTGLGDAFVQEAGVRRPRW